MKKVSIISAIISFALLLLWLVFTFVWLAILDFPTKPPYFINLGFVITFILFIGSLALFAYSQKDLIKKELNHFINNL